MLLIEILRNKPNIVVNGEQIKDLTERSVEFTNSVIVDTGIVSDDMVMRPDLLARTFFRDANKVDYLMKFNGISNPFSININDVMLIPKSDDIKSAIKPKKVLNQEARKDEVVKKFFDPNRLSKKDNKRLEYLQNKSKQMANGSKTNLPPNFAEPGSQELKVVNGRVIFGDDVVPSSEKCIDPLSKARAKSKLIQNKIFRNTL